MSREVIELGTLAAGGQDGDDLRTALEKVNRNFEELYAPGGAIGVELVQGNNTWTGRQTYQYQDDKFAAGVFTPLSKAMTVAPTSDSLRSVFLEKLELTYNSGRSLRSGAWVSSQQKVLNTAGAGTVDKLVVDMVQLNVTGARVKAALGYEAVLSYVDPASVIESYAGFYFPNIAAVPNIANVQKMAAFQNDERRAHVMSRGPFLNGDLVEVAPPFHPGLIPGRYYAAPARSMTQAPVAPSAGYVTYVHIPARATLTKLGFNVVNGAAGVGRLALYKVANGRLKSLVTQSGELSTEAAGPVEASISAEVDSGTYAIVALFSASPVISWHEISPSGALGARSPTGFSEYAFIPGIPYGPLPENPDILPTFEANAIEPHLWFRVGV